MSFDIVAKNGNNVDAIFDFVERIFRLIAFANVASTLWLVWTRLKVVSCPTFALYKPCTYLLTYLVRVLNER